MFLLKDFHHALAAGEAHLGDLIQIGAKLGKSRQLTILSQIQAQLSGHLFHRLNLCGATNPGYGNPHVNGRTEAGVEKVSLQEDLPVGDGNNVGGNVSRNISRLGLNDGKGGHGTAAQIRGEFGSPFKQTGMEIEDVSGIGFTAGRTFQKQGQFTVCRGLLG